MNFGDLTLKYELSTNALYPYFRQFAYFMQNIIWLIKGKSESPPHFQKQIILKRYAGLYGSKIFIESGTYFGDMIWCQKNNFKKYYSIELSEYLYKLSLKRFKSNPAVQILNGDSGKVLFDLMKAIDQDPKLFWLDGHYSAGVTAKGEKNCPVIEELNAILPHLKTQDVILIDDAPYFNGQNDYPSVQELKAIVQKNAPHFNVSLDSGILVIASSRT
jgi:hypothetical protein